MATYTKCDNRVQILLKEMMTRHHPELIEAGLTVDLLFAKSATDKPAISVNGYGAIAQVKINGLKERVLGLADVRILIDEDHWKEFADDRKAAVIDHELYHLLPRRDKLNAIREDDCGRPKLWIRKHDWHGGGFYDIVKRHQQAAVEAQMILDVGRKFTQGVLDFGERAEGEI